jgi:hypothetical protein
MRLVVRQVGVEDRTNRADQRPFAEFRDEMVYGAP